MAISVGSTTTTNPSAPNGVVQDRFSSPPIIQSFDGLLFDMDGTIIDSTNAIVKHWEEIGKKYGIDPNVILATSHGRRSIDVFQQIDPEHATWDFVQKMEAEIPLRFGADAVEINGARALLTQVDDLKLPWAIVTSGTRPLVAGWLKILNLAYPQYLVTAEDVKRGKPDPACYLLGKQKLNLKEPSSILVVEDAPAGIRAGKAAGFKVLALATTHGIGELRTAGADWIVRDLASVNIKSFDGASGLVTLEIRDSLEFRKAGL